MVNNNVSLLRDLLIERFYAQYKQFVNDKKRECSEQEMTNKGIDVEIHGLTAVEDISIQTKKLSNKKKIDYLQRRFRILILIIQRNLRKL